MFAPAAAAAAADLCEIRVDGKSVPVQGSPDQPVLVEADEDVGVEGTAGSPGDRYRVTLDYFGVPTEVATGIAGSNATWQVLIKTADYSWLGVGTYRLVGSVEGSAPCSAVVYVRILGSPLGSVAGMTGLGLAAVGGIVVLISVVGASRAGPAGKGASPTGPARAGLRPAVDAAHARLEQLRTISERARASRAMRVAAGGSVSALGALGGKALVTTAVDPGAELPEIDVYEVVLEQPVDHTTRMDLATLDATILGYLPPATYRLVLTAQQTRDVSRLRPVQEIRRYGLDQTVTAALLDETTGTDRRTSARLFDCMVHRESDLPDVLAAVKDAPDMTLVSTGRDVVRISASPDSAAVAELADRLDVRRLLFYDPPSLMSDHGRVIIGIDGIAATDAVPPGGWTGAGELVAIFDSGVDVAHPDLAGRVEFADDGSGSPSTDLVGHGTHVAGIVAGSGAASSGAIRGVAPDVHLVSFGIVGEDGTLGLPPDLGDLLVRAAEHGARIINLSWGSASFEDYDSIARSIDRFVVEHPDVLVVIAAGNGGTAPQGHHSLRTVFSPASAKNALSIGASDTDRIDSPPILWSALFRDRFPKPPASTEQMSGDRDLPAAISSRGPTQFHSIKPDLLAPGTFVRSARATHFQQHLSWRDDPDFGGKYVFSTGTSSSAPFVSGAAAVIRQYLRTQAVQPSAALMKAILIGAARRLPSRRENTADDYGYPDFDQGFGCLDLRILFDPGALAVPARFVDVADSSDEALDARAAPGSNHAAVAGYSVEVAGGRPLRITLAWTDRPGIYVQNNLQLEVTGPRVRLAGNGEHRYLKDPQAADPLATGIIFDKWNNVEQVVIGDPLAGTYRIRVLAENIPFPAQGYAMCVTGELVSALRHDRRQPGRVAATQSADADG